MVPLKELTKVYLGELTFDAVVKAARCSSCKGKSISSAELIYVSNSEVAMDSSHTLKKIRTFKKKKRQVYLMARLMTFESFHLKYIKATSKHFLVVWREVNI